MERSVCVDERVQIKNIEGHGISLTGLASHLLVFSLPTEVLHPSDSIEAHLSSAQSIFVCAGGCCY